MGMQDLPQELVDAIIESVPAEDKDTLLSCSLVRRNWLPSSRRKLLEDIIIDRLSVYNLLVERVLRSDELKPYLETTRSIRLYTYFMNPITPTTPTVNPLPILYTFYGCFPKLEVLSIGDPRAAYPFLRSTEPLLLAQFPTLRVLKLWYCSFPSFGALRRAISALPALRELDMLEVRLPRSTRLARALPFSPALGLLSPHLRSLVFQLFAVSPNEDYSHVFLHWLSTHRSISTLENLHFGYPEGEGSTTKFFNEPGHVAFFQRVARSVTSLTLEPRRRSPLTYFTNLSSLTLLPVDPFSATWDIVCEMLGELQSPMLRCLRFKLVWYHGSQPGSQTHRPALGPHNACFCLLPDSGLAQLDAVLARDVFKHLVRVEFTLQRAVEDDKGDLDHRDTLLTPAYPALDHGELLAQTQVVLPQLFARGVIAFNENRSHFPRVLANQTDSLARPVLS